MLEEFKNNLARSLTFGARSPDVWGNPKAMSKALAVVRRQHDGPLEIVDQHFVSIAISQYRKSGQLKTFRETKYVCLGVTQVNDEWCLLSNNKLLEALLAKAELGEPRHQLKLFQCLLSSYWFSPRYEGRNSPHSTYLGWNTLRSWLAKRQKSLDSFVIRKPEWFTVIGQHSNLLTERPCDRYAPALLDGNNIEINRVTKSLAIPIESWVMEEAIFSQIRTAAALPDERFKDFLPKLIRLSKGDAEVMLSKDLTSRCVAELVSRYSRCDRRPENTVLCKLACAHIGNPWLRRDAWDAYVRKENGRPDDAAREMINSWLKRGLIKGFFELLSEDGSADPRRLQYWLRFEPFIEDMWFALGSHACKNQSKGFIDFRQAANGRLLELEDATAGNNAFIMRIGEYLAVEFGMLGNAFFLFRWENITKELSQKLTEGKESPSIEISKLRSSRNKARLIHKDSPSRGLSWEQIFDDNICDLLGRPNEEPRRFGRRGSRAPIQRESNLGSKVKFTQSKLDVFVSKHSLNVLDSRSKGGALWVIAGDSNLAITTPLQNWGFRFKAGKGWWKE